MIKPFGTTKKTTQDPYEQAFNKLKNHIIKGTMAEEKIKKILEQSLQIEQIKNRAKKLMFYAYQSNKTDVYDFLFQKRNELEINLNAPIDRQYLIHEIIKKNDFDEFTKFQNAGGEIDINNNGMTSLHYAVQIGSYDIVNSLLSIKEKANNMSISVNKNIENKDGQKPIDMLFARNAQKNDGQILQLLIEDKFTFQVASDEFYQDIISDLHKNTKKNEVKKNEVKTFDDATKQFGNLSYEIQKHIGARLIYKKLSDKTKEKVEKPNIENLKTKTKESIEEITEAVSKYIEKNHKDQVANTSRMITEAAEVINYTNNEKSKIEIEIKSSSSEKDLLSKAKKKQKKQTMFDKQNSLRNEIIKLYDDKLNIANQQKQNIELLQTDIKNEKSLQEQSIKTYTEITNDYLRIAQITEAMTAKNANDIEAKQKQINQTYDDIEKKINDYNKAIDELIKVQSNIKIQNKQIEAQQKSIEIKNEEIKLKYLNIRLEQENYRKDKLNELKKERGILSRIYHTVADKKERKKTIPEEIKNIESQIKNKNNEITRLTNEQTKINNDIVQLQNQQKTMITQQQNPSRNPNHINFIKISNEKNNLNNKIPDVFINNNENLNTTHEYLEPQQPRQFTRNAEQQTIPPNMTHESHIYEEINDSFTSKDHDAQSTLNSTLLSKDSQDFNPDDLENIINAEGTATNTSLLIRNSQIGQDQQTTTNTGNHNDHLNMIQGFDKSKLRKITPSTSQNTTGVNNHNEQTNQFTNALNQMMKKNTDIGNAVYNSDKIDDSEWETKQNPKTTLSNYSQISGQNPNLPNDN